MKRKVGKYITSSKLTNFPCILYSLFQFLYVKRGFTKRYVALLESDCFVTLSFLDCLSVQKKRYVFATILSLLFFVSKLIVLQHFMLIYQPHFFFGKISATCFPYKYKLFTHFDKNLGHVLQINHNNEINKRM